MSGRWLGSIPNKRAFLARGLTATGVTRALEALGGRGRAAVLTYHRIAEQGASNPFYDPVVSATPEGFHAQMEMVRRRFRVVGPEDLIADPTGEAGRDRRPCAVVTFDDGCRDNYDAALPILVELGVPATFFIPTGFLERPRLPWWDHVAYVVKRTARARFAVERSPDDPSPIEVEIDPAAPDRSAPIASLIRPVLDGLVPDQEWFLRRLEERAEVDVDSPALGRSLFMTWEHLKAIAAAGCTVGSHAHGHVALATLDDRSIRRELALSRTILEAAVGRPVRSVAYPYGWPGSVDARAYRLAADAGYRVGFTATEGLARPEAPDFHPLAIPRLTIGAGDTPAMLRTRTAFWAMLGRSWV